MNHLFDIVRSLRPHQWAKNILLFSGLFFSLSIFNFPLLVKTVIGFISFVMASSSIYLLNDLMDYRKDRLHPVKKHRPIAAGKISKTEALLISVLLFALSVILGWYYINYFFIIIIITYCVTNITYTLFLKRIMIVDVIIVSVGFLLRIVAGNVVIEIKPSMWIVLCTFLLAMIFSLGKRRIELGQLLDHPEHHRKTLGEYKLPFIDNLLNIVIAAAIVTYALYTMSEETVKRFNTEWLINTTPVVVYALFRYLYLIQHKNRGDDPTILLFTDKHLVISGIVWIILLIAIIYIKSELNYKIIF